MAQQAAQDLENTWRKLSEGLHQIMNKLEEGLTNHKYVELYTLIYNYCTSSRMTGANELPFTAQAGGHRGANLMGKDLYEKLKDYLKTHLQGMLTSSEQHMDESLLIFYTRQWSRYTTASTLVHHIFRYLNRHWVKREIDEGHKTIYDVYTLSLVSWRDNFFMPLQANVMKAVLGLIEKQRNGEQIDNGLIKSVADSFVSLGLDESDSSKSTLEVYKQYFETPFVDATEIYYKAESEKFITDNTITDYMKKAESRLLEEENRVPLYLNPSTSKPLIKRCETVLIANHTNPIQEEFQTLLDQDKTEDLSRIYNLLSRVDNGLSKLINIFENHVRKQGLEAVQKVAEAAASQAASGKGGDDEDGEEDEKPAPSKSTAAAAAAKKKQAAGSDIDPKVYVEALLAVHSKYQTLVSKAFKADSGFVAALDKACREFVNRNHVCKEGSQKSPQLLAQYCDSLLRKGGKVAEETEVEEVLNQIMTVFKYVEDKDVFQKFYSKMLAKRLVNSTSSSEDSESMMISKLKDACGYEYTSKLQRMFTDVNVSKDLNDEFKGFLERQMDGKDAFDAHIQVLGSAAWPLNPPSTPFNLPTDLTKTFELFQKFYSNKHSGRKLTWLFQMSKGELKTNYVKGEKGAKGTYTFMVSNYQMGILLQYNAGDKYTFSELESATSLSPEVLTGNLNILTKSRVLICETPTVTKDSVFKLNFDFKNKKLKVNLNIPIKSEQKTETEETHKIVEEDRRMLIQAAIVRIMKTRKLLKHNALIAEVIEQLKARFQPKIPDIKKAIDVLLEKEYLERSDTDKDTFSYVA
ncbi:hypothetical protein SmJEL517_g05059 [Synchytrium microbalum]|uniref:Cullin family profile domain-containing protein n=1 Tax=Synchytrium microbalum TaxID=1806994 RepID=A0A507C0Q7_9FUNG|nr:uncharacterized protein SmJEL517_g05059 [Synchytrium microbalum]TPX31644.1 hypothetical protein SmJEL517_g05059 [Synchytrium microbalum]